MEHEFKIFPELPEALGELSVEELTELRDSYRSAGRSIRDKSADLSVFGEVTDEQRAELTVAEFTAGVVGLKLIEDELTLRSEGEETFDATLAEVASDVDLGETELAAEPDPDPDPDAETTDADEPENTDAKVETVETGTKVEITETVEAGTASASPRRMSLPATPRNHAPAVVESEGEAVAQFVASAGIPHIQAGTPLDRAGLREAFVALAEQATTLPEGARQNVPVARLDYGRFWPEDRVFGSDPVENFEKVLAVVGPDAYGVIPGTNERALIASGGICAAPTPFYEVLGYGRAHRPVRDFLPSFNARRGGIQYAGGLSLASVDETAFGAVTAAEDAVGGTTGAKTCWHIDCPDYTTTTIEAIYRCLEIGNFNARTWPELINTFVSETLAAHARFAESRLLTTIAAGSNGLTQAKKYGALSTMVMGLVQVAARYRSQYRTDPNLRFQVLLPQWLPDLLYADAIHSDFQKYDVTRAGITRVLREAGVEPGWYADEAAGTGQIFAVEAADTAVDEFPDHVFAYMFPAGTWLHLDGGTLDLGVVRDSDLNLSNDYQQFAEDFENVAFTGIESVEIDFTICPDGTYAPAGSAITC